MWAGTHLLHITSGWGGLRGLAGLHKDGGWSLRGQGCKKTMAIDIMWPVSLHCMSVDGWFLHWSRPRITSWDLLKEITSTGYRVSDGEDVLEMGGGDGCILMATNLMPQICILRNGWSGKFYLYLTPSHSSPSTLLGPVHGHFDL